MSRGAARILTMSLEEIGVRTRQAIWIAADRLARALPGPGKRAGAEIRARPPVPGLGQIAAVAEFVRRDASADAREIVRAADRIMAGEVELLGYGPLRVGFPPQWTREPLRGIVAPRRHWSRVRFLDPREVGDSKVVWELNRHHQLLVLAQAYQLTGERRYALAVWAAVRSWMKENPPGVGINWCSSLEVALRGIAWCWLWHLADGPSTAPANERAAFGSTLAAHARHVEKFLSWYFAPNTHLTGEGLGLCYMATTFPELPRGERWWRLGSRVLATALEHQIRPDGLHFERSACYHLYTLDFYVHFALLHGARGEVVPPRVRAAVAALADATNALRQPDGRLPAVGDDDSGRLLGPLSGPPLDPAISLAAAAAVSADGAAPPSGWPAAAAWLLGRPTTNELDEPRRLPRLTVRAFRPSGFVVARWADDYLLVSAGLQSPAQRCLGHVHDDAMAVVLWCGGAPIWIDPGTHVYTADVESRNWYRSAAAHASARVDGCPEPPRAPTFHWVELSTASLNAAWQSEEAYGIELARRFAIGNDEVVHRRGIVGWIGAGWIVWDRFDGGGERLVELRFPLAGTVGVMRQSMDGTLQLPTATLGASTSTGIALSRGLVKAPVSPAYGALRCAHAWQLSLRGRLPFECVTVALKRDEGREWIVGDLAGAAGGVAQPFGLAARAAGTAGARHRIQVGSDGPLVWEHAAATDGALARTLILSDVGGPARLVAAAVSPLAEGG